MSVSGAAGHADGIFECDALVVRVCPPHQIILNMTPRAHGSVRQHVRLGNAQVGERAEHLDAPASGMVSSKV